MHGLEPTGKAKTLRQKDWFRTGPRRGESHRRSNPYVHGADSRRVRRIFQVNDGGTSVGRGVDSHRMPVPFVMRRRTPAMARMCIVSNNPLVAERLSPKWEVDYRKVGYTELLEWVRDFIQEGAVLLSHPLAGSVKPGETPYRSVLVQMPAVGAAEGRILPHVDPQSLQLIESAIQTARKFPQRTDEFRPESIEDFQLVDLTLIQSALDSVI